MTSGEQNPKTASLDRSIRQLSDALGFIGVSLLAALALMTTVDVVARYFGFALTGINDLIGLGIAAAIACCFPVALAHDGHIRLEFATQRLGPRGKAWLDAGAGLILLTVLAGILWRLAAFAESETQSGNVTWILRIPTGPWWWIVSAIIALSVLVQLGVVVLRLAALFRREGAAPP